MSLNDMDAVPDFCWIWVGRRGGSAATPSPSYRSSIVHTKKSSGREATSTWQPVGGVGVGLVARFASFVLYTVDRSREDNVIMLHHFLKSGDLLDRHLSFAS